MVVETQTAPATALPQEQCAPVGDEFGTPASPELLQDPEFKEVVEEMSANLIAAHAIVAEDLESGEAAGRALKSLGCVACELSTVCTVRETLTERAESGRETQAILDKAKMISNAPTWLKAARFNKSGMTPGDIQTLLTDNNAAAEAMENGVLDRLIGDATNKPLKPTTKDEIPEVAGVSVVPKDKPLRTDEITNKHGQKFVVVDATNQNYPRENVTAESRAEYGILTAKLVDRMNALGPDGKPLVLTPDNKMQKQLRHTGSGSVYEIRMRGKNRLYISVTPSPENTTDAVARIVILGAHGGDASTQRAFIDSGLN